MSADPLLAFWAARLDEDEAAAKAAAGETAAGWFTGTSEEPDERSVCYTGPSTLRPGSMWDYRIADRVPLAAAAHIVLRDPARALREAEADRRLIGLHRPEWNDYVDGDGIERTSLECSECEPGGSPDNWPCPTVRGRVAVWDAHPDYRQEWKPRP